MALQTEKKACSKGKERGRRREGREKLWGKWGEWGEGAGTGKSERYAKDVEEIEGVWKWWEKLLKDPANIVNWSQFVEQFKFHTPEPRLIFYAVGAMRGSATECSRMHSLT